MEAYFNGQLRAANARAVEQKLCAPQTLPKAQKDYDKRVADELYSHFQNKMSTATFGENPSRIEDVRTRLIDNLSEHDQRVPGREQSEPQLNDVILDRLRLGIQHLNERSVYNSTDGRKQKHFLYQLLCDPILGKDDPWAQLLAKELGINLKTFNKCAEERKEHFLGFFPLAAERAGSITTLEIEVDSTPVSQACEVWIVCV